MKKLLALLLALAMLTMALASCGGEEEPKDTAKQTEENKATEEQNNKEETDKKETTDNQETESKDESKDENQEETETETKTETETESETQRVSNFDEFLHSETYERAKAKWFSVWNYGSQNAKTDFLTKAAPFKFLKEQGVVYYNDDGEPRAYGTDDNFYNYKAIQSKAWIDPETEENDFYLLTQYISAPVDDENSNGKTYVATYMLRYILEDDCYRDLLLLSADFRVNLLIQQIDQEYMPEVISKSIIRYDAIWGLGLFRDLPHSGVNQSTMDSRKKDVCNYVSNIDYENLSITVNYNNINPIDGKGKIYSYTYKLKETSSWHKIPEGGKYTAPIPKEERDALTNEQLMPTFESNAGTVLDSTRAFSWTLGPSDEQKATATVKYEFNALKIGGTVPNDTVQKYEGGAITYSEVNNLTRYYVSNLKSK